MAKKGKQAQKSAKRSKSNLSSKKLGAVRNMIVSPRDPQ